MRRVLEGTRASRFTLEQLRAMLDSPSDSVIRRVYLEVICSVFSKDSPNRHRFSLVQSTT